MLFILPYGHEGQTVRRLPYVTFAIIAVNILAYALISMYTMPDIEWMTRKGEMLGYYRQHDYLQVPDYIRPFLTDQENHDIDLRSKYNERIPGDRSMEAEQSELDRQAKELYEAKFKAPKYKYALQRSAPTLKTMITSMFIHDDLLHLFGNMIFLYVAGCILEDLWGRPLYLVFYLLGGIAAHLTQVRFDTDWLWAFGAAGAVSALMGAFLVRLYKTRVYFVYVIFYLFRFRTGSFRMPAFVLLPVWFLENFILATLGETSPHIVYWPHLGGFLFGACFAVAINMLRVEEKYLRPAIEKKVSLSQNPLFEQAIESSEKSDYVNALILLERLVRQEPNNLEAYLEMRRIAQIEQDREAYTRYSAAILELLLRTREWDLLVQHYSQFQECPLRLTLPARTLFSLATFFEEQCDYPSAALRYEELCSHYPEDGLTMKAYSKLARLYVERLQEAQRGVNAFWKSYDHPLSDDQWRLALQSDMKRLGIFSRGKD